MTRTKIEKAVDRVRDAVSQASEGMTLEEYQQFLGELLADAEGWKMELEEQEDK